MDIEPKELARELDDELESTRISIDRLYDRYVELDDEENIEKMIHCFDYLEKIYEITNPMCEYNKS